MDLDPSVIGVIFTGIVLSSGLLLYIIRAEIRRNTKTTDATHEQMIPNHGTSLRDAIDRIERRQQEDRDAYHSLISDVHADVKATRADLATHINWHLSKEN